MNGVVEESLKRQSQTVESHSQIIFEVKLL